MPNSWRETIHAEHEDSLASIPGLHYHVSVWKWLVSWEGLGMKLHKKYQWLLKLITRSSPSIFAYRKRKNWMVGRPGNEAISCLHVGVSWPKVKSHSWSVLRNVGLSLAQSIWVHSWSCWMPMGTLWFRCLLLLLEFWGHHSLKFHELHALKSLVDGPLQQVAIHRNRDKYFRLVVSHGALL